MSGEKIELAEARELLLRAVETQGREFVYNPDGGTCRNVPYAGYPVKEDDPRRKTGCLVGTAMSLSGRIEDMQEYGWGSVNIFDHLLSKSAVDYFAVAQVVQDNGGSWGDAYDRAQEFADETIRSCLSLSGRGR